MPLKNTGQQLHQDFVSGKVKAEEIVSQVLRNITTQDNKLGAFLSVFNDRALRKAKELDAKLALKKKLGKLAGIPIAVKDNILVKGEITTCGSKFLTNFRAPYDAHVVSELEKEDALIIGKTNMDEFGMGSSTEFSAFHPSHNPWNLACTPGGSSGGSSAAVAARLCPIALGSDTGGSIRQPAAFTGIFGFKPSYGRVSRYGLVAYASSFDQIGPMATTVEDIALTMEVIGKHDPRDSTCIDLADGEYSKKLSKDSLKGLKIGVPWKFLEDLAQEAKENFLASIETLKSLGASIVDVDLDILKTGIAVYYILATAEASTNLARFDGIRYGVRSAKAKTLDEVYSLSKQEGFGPEVKNRILLGTYVLSAGYQDAYYRKAQKVRTLIIRKFREAFAHCNAIVLPASPFPAYPIGSIHDPLQMYLQDIYTIAANLAGVPGISVPSGFSKSGMPFGLQILGPQMHDAQVLSYAYAFQHGTEFYKKTPPVSL